MKGKDLKMTKKKLAGNIIIMILLAITILATGREDVHAADGWMREKHPYQYTNTTEYIAGNEEYFTIGGTDYDEGYVFYLWNAARTSQVLYNLKGEYSNFSFYAGHIDQKSMYTAKLKIYLDGELNDTIELNPSDIAKRVSINVDGVKQLKIKMESDEPENHYDIYYGIYNGEFIKNGFVSEEIPVSNMVGNKEPYQTVGGKTKVVKSKDKEKYFMGGDEYTDALQMYLWNPSKASQIYFNFGGEYKSMRFLFGHIDNTTRARAALEITIDGELSQTIAVEADDLPVPVTVPLEDVHQMTLSLTSDTPDNTYDLYYGIGAIQLESLGYVRGISLNMDKVKLTENDSSVRLKATIIPNDARNQNYTWSSSDASVAVVDENGVVRAVSKGSAVVTVTTNEGGYTAECIVTVDIADKKISSVPDKTEKSSEDLPSVADVKSLKAKAGKKKIILTWKKALKVSGYQVQFGTKKNFKDAKTKKINKSKKRYVIKKLESRKKYYVRIRAYKNYKNTSGKTGSVNGKWISTSVKVK